jgi:murein DD-endopeptidase MepM/ murein hydrolase activator NlpD
MMMELKRLHAISLGFALIVAACATSEVVRPPETATDAPKPPPQKPAAPAKNVFPATMSVCPGMTVANRPATDANLVMTDYRQFVVAEGKVTLASAPVEAGCFSSGFGPRSFSNHKGVDYYAAEAVDIYAAADGTVKEKTYRDDFGNMVVIDHGDGVFTRYAHLESFGEGLAVGKTVKRGDVLGLMGNTSKYKVARHLHYEVLTGTWGAQAGSFALTPVDVTKLPVAGGKA